MDLMKHPSRSVTITNLCVDGEERDMVRPKTQQTKSHVNLAMRKAQPSMGVLAHSLKSKNLSKSSNWHSQISAMTNMEIALVDLNDTLKDDEEEHFIKLDRKDLAPFLDSLDSFIEDEFLTPITSSTISSLNLETREKPNDLNLSPMTMLKRRANKKLRSLSVVEISDLDSFGKKPIFTMENIFTSQV